MAYTTEDGTSATPGKHIRLNALSFYSLKQRDIKLDQIFGECQYKLKNKGNEHGEYKSEVYAASVAFLILGVYESVSAWNK